MSWKWEYALGAEEAARVAPADFLGAVSLRADELVRAAEALHLHGRAYEGIDPKGGDMADMEGDGAFDPRTLIAAIEIVSRSNPDNDWVTQLRDYPLIGVPVYAIFDPRTGEGAVLTDIHTTPEGPRYATRKDFVYGEDVTIGNWTISTDDLPLYQPIGR